MNAKRGGQSGTAQVARRYDILQNLDFVGTDPDGMEIPEGFRLIFEIKMG